MQNVAVPLVLKRSSPFALTTSEVYVLFSVQPPENGSSRNTCVFRLAQGQPWPNSSVDSHILSPSSSSCGVSSSWVTGVQGNVSTDWARGGGFGFSSVVSWTFSVMSLGMFLEEKRWAWKWAETPGMSSAFKEAYLQCIKCRVLTVCRMSFMKLISKRMKCPWQGLASEEIQISPVEASHNLLGYMGSSVHAILLGTLCLLPCFYSKIWKADKPSITQFCVLCRFPRDSRS